MLRKLSFLYAFALAIWGCQESSSSFENTSDTSALVEEEVDNTEALRNSVTVNPDTSTEADAHVFKTESKAEFTSEKTGTFLTLPEGTFPPNKQVVLSIAPAAAPEEGVLESFDIDSVLADLTQIESLKTTQLSLTSETSDFNFEPTLIESFVIETKDLNGEIDALQPFTVCRTLDDLGENESVIIAAVNKSDLSVQIYYDEQITLNEKTSCIESVFSNGSYYAFSFVVEEVLSAWEEVKVAANAADGSTDSNDSTTTAAEEPVIVAAPVEVDSIAPLGGSISIDAGAEITSDLSFALTISATDNDVAKMAISQAGDCSDITDDSWVDFAKTAQLDYGLSVADGLESTVTIGVLFQDAAGNKMAKSKCVKDSIIIDKQAPGSTSVEINVGALYATSEDLNVATAATDAEKVFLSTDQNQSPSDEGALVYSSTSTYTVTIPEANRNEGEVVFVYAWFRDNRGNWTKSAATDSIIYDATEPQNPAVTLVGATSVGGKSYLTSLGSTYYTAAASGASQVFVTAAADCSGEPTWESLSSPSFALSEGVETTIRAKFRDLAGNETACVEASEPIMFDSTSPDETGASFVNPGKTFFSPAIEWTGFADSGSGIDHYEVKIGTTADGSEIIDWTNVGTTIPYQSSFEPVVGANYFVYVRAVDRAGNVSEQISETGYGYNENSYVEIQPESSAGVRDYHSSANFGRSGSAAVYGDYAIVGAGYRLESAYAYKTDDGGLTWNFKQKIPHPTGGAHQWFGDAVAISGQWAFIGDPLFDTATPTSNAGAVHIYKTDDEGDSWTYQSSLNPDIHERFGTRVVASGTTVAILSSIVRKVRFYEMVESGGALSLELKSEIDAPTESQNDPPSNTSSEFGDQISIDGDYALIAARTAALNKGRVFVYKRNTADNTWSQVSYFDNPNSTLHRDYFGTGLSYDDGYAVITGNRLAYLYKRDGDNFNLVDINSSGGADSDDNIFESSNSQYKATIKGTTVVIGVPGQTGHLGGPNNAGAVMILKLDKTTDTLSNYCGIKFSSLGDCNGRDVFDPPYSYTAPFDSGALTQEGSAYYGDHVIITDDFMYINAYGKNAEYSTGDWFGKSYFIKLK